VFTWGNNRYGQLGIDNDEVMMQMRPDSKRPLRFADNNMIDITAGYDSFMALSDKREVFVWGLRMGIYPELNDLSQNAIEKYGF
jgi:alpha-tubulin suppressor-like RCC1 family protein